MPVGVLTRSGHGTSEKQHTSADDLGQVLPSSLADSLLAALEAVHALEANALVSSPGPGCEPQLGRRGVYRDLALHPSRKLLESALPWLMSLGDGNHSLVDVARRSSIPFAIIAEAARVLEGHALLRLDEIPAARSGAASVGGVQ
jgi:aminopeptidase-like protein